MPVRYPQPEIRFIGTGGVVNDLARVHELRDKNLMPPTGRVWPRQLVLDLTGADFTPSALETLIIPLGQRLASGAGGDVAGLVLATPDPALARAIGLLAQEHKFPFFIARSSRPEDVQHAVPAGELTPSEAETLEQIARNGGRTTVADLAERLEIEPTAANNRLVNLTRRGFVYRVERNRRQGAEFVDPRQFDVDVFLTDAVRPPRGFALRTADIETDPYTTEEPLELEGDAANRAAEILRRRKAAQ